MNNFKISSRRAIRKHYDKYLITYTKLKKIINNKEENKIEDTKIELIRMKTLLEYDIKRKNSNLFEKDKEIIEKIIDKTLQLINQINEKNNKEELLLKLKKYKTMYEILVAYSVDKK